MLGCGQPELLLACGQEGTTTPQCDHSESFYQAYLRCTPLVDVSESKALPFLEMRKDGAAPQGGGDKGVVGSSAVACVHHVLTCRRHLTECACLAPIFSSHGLQLCWYWNAEALAETETHSKAAIEQDPTGSRLPSEPTPKAAIMGNHLPIEPIAVGQASHTAPLCKGHQEPCVKKRVNKSGPNRGQSHAYSEFTICPAVTAYKSTFCHGSL